MKTGLLHASTVGPEEAPAVVFLHGFLGRGADWDPVVAKLADSHRCVTVDLPGHGLSTELADPDGYVFEGAADAVRATVAASNIQRPMLVGYSMGGRLALFLALRFPEEFSGAVVESASPGLISYAQRAARIEHDQAVAERLSSMPLKEFLEIWYRQPVFGSLAGQSELLQRRIAGRMQNDPIELARALEGMSRGRQPSLWKELPGLNVPALFVAGRRDRKYVEIGRRMARRCHGGRLEIVAGAGHTVHAEAPEAMARLIASGFQRP